MIVERGDMLADGVYNRCDYAFITTNSFRKKNGALVMGAGIAKQVRDRFPGIDGSFKFTHMSEYGIVQSSLEPKIWAFQVKKFWGSAADVKLIMNSTSALREFALANPDKTIYLNYPGIGNGRLRVEEVEPIISTLPDNVYVWRL